MKKQVRCPNCHIILTITGASGSTETITCPSCGLKGNVTFQKQTPHSPQENNAIQVINLQKKYGDLIAVNSISFTVKKGEIFAFLGPNGAGKTTTVEMIESIRKPTQGTITLFGQDISTSFDTIKEKIGILPQEFHSFERLTVKETLEYYASLFRNHADITSILKMMDLQDHTSKLYKDLSGGLKQRVGVAIALVNDPEIIFLDEPTTGLDPKARREVWNVISDLRNHGKTIFLTTHYMEEAEFLSDHIAIIHKGNIIAEGTLEFLIQRYGEGTMLHLKNCNHPHIVDLLQNQGYKVHQQDQNSISVVIEYKDRILEILSFLRHECIDYKEIDIDRPNLEEIFLSLTGEKLQEENT